MLNKRLIAPADIPAVSALRVAYLDETYGGLPPAQARDLARENQAYLEQQLGSGCLVAAAFDGDTAVSCVYLTVICKAANRRFPNGRYGEIYGVYTLPAYRRRGLATDLMRLVMQAAPELRLSFLELEASADGFPVYRKLGFQESPSEYRRMLLPLP